MLQNQWIVNVVLLLVSVTLVGPVVECPQGQGCTPCRTLSPWSVEIYCGREKELSESHFQIEYGPKVFDGKYNDVLEIKCVGGPEWSDFHLGTRKTMKLVSIMRFTDCNLPAGIQLISIAYQLFNSEAAEAEGLNSRPRLPLPADLRELKFNSYGNLTSTLTGTTFAGFSNCVTVDLSHNGLQTVPEDLLRDFINLETLDLSFNDLHEIPPMFLNLNSLQTFTLEENKILAIERTVLVALDLSQNQITRIDRHALDALKNLGMLNLRGNNLTTLPLNLFSNLNNFADLNLSNNNFSIDFLPCLYNSLNDNIKILELSHNKQNLTTLPEKFLPNKIRLETLKLDDNGITNLPRDLLAGAPSIKRLSLSGNYLMNLPDNLFLRYTSGHFKIVNLSRNHFTDIFYNDFNGLDRIDQLDMSYNSINFRRHNEFLLHKFPVRKNNVFGSAYWGSAFDSMRVARQNESDSLYERIIIATRELNLENNNISTILAEWRMASRLNALRLRYNQFTRLSHLHLCFHSNETVELDLRDNKIVMIDLSGFESPEFNLSEFDSARNYPVVSLQVMNNPIECDCSIYHLLRHHEEKMSSTIQQLFQISIEGLTCAGPHELRDVPVKNLTSKALQCRLPRSSPDNRTCPDVCDCLHRVEDRAFIVNCSHRGLQTIPTINRPGFYSVTVLFLSFNQISNLSLSDLPENLKELYLHGNNLTQLDKDVIRFLTDSAELKSLTLHENPWKCDCDTLDFFKFIQTKQSTFADLQRVTCKSSDTPIFKMSSKEMCPPSLAIIVGAIMAAILLLMTALSAAVYYRYETEIKVWLFAHRLLPWFVNEAELDRDKIYDAFVSYSHQDEDFVENTLVPRLEEGPHAFKLCVHYRDWLAR